MLETGDFHISAAKSMLRSVSLGIGDGSLDFFFFGLILQMLSSQPHPLSRLPNVKHTVLAIQFVGLIFLLYGIVFFCGVSGLVFQG
jgi:ABC-type transport system involved in cytochrome c biogenesis permease subunit